MTTDPRWTAGTVRAAADAIRRSWRDTGTGGSYHDDAAHVLGVLADLGVLLPPGGTTREEWVAEVDMGSGYRQSPTHSPYVADSEAAIDAYMRGIIKPKRKARRTVYEGPWTPVEAS